MKSKQSLQRRNGGNDFDADALSDMSDDEWDDYLDSLRAENREAKSLNNCDYFVFEPTGFSLIRAINVLRK